MMTKDEMIDAIIERYKGFENKGRINIFNCCPEIDCDYCPFECRGCTNDIAMSVLERLVKVEEQSKSFEKTCYKLQQALEEKAETNFDHYYDGKLAFDDFANTGDEKLIADIYTLCFKPGTDKVYKQSGIYDFKRWLLSPYKEPKPKYKLSQFEYDLLECYEVNRRISEFWLPYKMCEKGYFKDIPTDVPIREIISNCEVVEE